MSSLRTESSRATPERVAIYGAVSVMMLVSLALAGCRQDMHDQPRIEPFETSTVFADGTSARSPERHTIARGFLREDDWFYRGTDEEGDWVTALPFAVDAEVVARGEERYKIYCSPCHGYTGEGRGTVVRAGFPEPAVLFGDKVRALPDGVIFDNITTGFGNMPALGALIPPRDRWHIVAYIRELQSKHSPDSGSSTADGSRPGEGSEEVGQ